MRFEGLIDVVVCGQIDSQKSLKELSGSLVNGSFRSVADETGNEIVDHDASLFELFGVIIFRSVKLSAVTASVTVAGMTELVDLGAIHSLGSPLPRVFTAIGEEDIGCCDIIGTLINLSLFYLGEDRHVEVVEDVRTVLFEVVNVESITAHGMIGAHSLEPAVLSAILEGPRASTAVDIDCSALYDILIIVDWAIARLVTVKNDGIGNTCIILTIEWL